MSDTANITAPTYDVRWHQRAGIWLGIAINPAAITLGGGIASRITLSSAFWVVPVGVFLLAALSVTAGIIGRNHRMRVADWSSKTFGLGIGMILVNLIMAFGMSGWSGFQMGLGGTSLANILGLPATVGVILLSITVLAMGLLGVNQWNALVWITTLSSLGLVLVALLVVGGGSAENVTLPTHSTNAIIWAIGSIIAYAALFSLRCTDFTYDMASAREVVYDGIVFYIALLISIFVGIRLFHTTGSWNLAEILSGTPYAIIGQLFVVVALISPALSGQHSGSLAWSQVLPITYLQGKIGIIIAGAILGITRFDQKLLPFLDWIGALLPPALAVMIFAILVKRDVSHSLALTAWGCGAFVAVLFKLNGQIIHLAAGALTGFIVILVGVYIKNPMSK